jgi:predicted outer membrane repeat protein
MWIQSPSLRIQIIDCEFHHNIAIVSGGAIYLEAEDVIISSQLSLRRCKFEGNYAEMIGGGLYLKNAHLLSEENTFKSNKASSYGGAIYVLNTENFSLVNSIFQDNQAQESGGALFIKNNARVLNYLDCLIRNRAANLACGLYADKVENGTLMISNSMFKQNTAYLTGGGAHFEGMHNLILENTTFLNNSGYVPEEKTSLFASSLRGGAIFYSCEDFNCSPKFTSLDVKYNSAEAGGAMYFNNHIFDPTIGNNFINNSANKYGDTFASSPVQILTAEEMKNDTNTMIRISLENGTVLSRDDFIQSFFIYNWTDSQLWKRFTGQTKNAIYPRISLKIEYKNQVAGDPLLEKLSFYALDYFGQQITVDDPTYYHHGSN